MVQIARNNLNSNSLPVLHPLPFAHMPPPLPRQRQPVGRSFATLFVGVSGRWRPSPLRRGVGLRIKPFGACSTFTRVMACALPEPPVAALFPRSASVRIVTSVYRTEYYRLERQLPGGITPPLGYGALARRTTFQPCSNTQDRAVGNACARIESLSLAADSAVGLAGI